MLELCQNFARIMLELCQNYARIMLEFWENYSIDVLLQCYGCVLIYYVTTCIHL